MCEVAGRESRLEWLKCSSLIDRERDFTINRRRSERCLLQRQTGYLVRDTNRFYGNMCKRYARCLPKGIAEDSVLGKINGKSVTNSDNRKGGSQHHSSCQPGQWRIVRETNQSRRLTKKLQSLLDTNTGVALVKVPQYWGEGGRIVNIRKET